MNKVSKFLFVGLVCGFCSQLRAEALDGYLGFSGGLIRHMTPADQTNGKDTRYGARIDFVRIQRNVALDLRLGNGLGYQDFGGTFKIFHHFAFSGSTATGISVGSGIGATYSSAGFDNSDASFYEIFAPVYARIMFDFGVGVGLFVDTEYNAMFQRRLSSGSQLGGSAVANRYFIGAGLAFSAM